METLWPWLAVAGLGMLHGLSPANGWMFAAACGVRTGDGAQARRALLPIAIGHAASVLVVVAAVTQGVLMDRTQVQALAGALLIGLAAYRLLRHPGPRTAIDAPVANGRIGMCAGHAGIAIWSGLMATAHGTGLMLVPAFASLCMASTPAREITASGSLVLALAAFGLHMAAMLVTTGGIATTVCRGVAMHHHLLEGTVPRRHWTASLATTGILLVALR